jgi:hypothetical protein
MQQENLAYIRHKLSIIYKHIQSMHNELRYSTKIHAIFEKLSKEKRKKNSTSSSPTYINIMLEKKERKITKTCL